MNLNLFLGQGMDGRNVYWANAENAHISILGQSGTGKTYLISRLAKEACRQGFNVVIPDYSDSFLQMQDSCVLHTDIRKINLDILSNSKGRDVEARAEELISSIRLFCEIGIVKQDTIRQLAVSFLQENSTNETVPELISYCEKQLKASSEIEMIRNYLGLIVPISADAYTHVSIRQPGMIHIIQFPYWMGSDQRLKYTEMILAQVWNEQICPCMASKPVIFVLDEAHGLHLGSQNMSTRILREGRKFGISGWFITQWADDIKMLNTLSQAALRIFFRPGTENIKSLAKALAHGNLKSALQYRQMIAGMRVGDFFFFNTSGNAVYVKTPTPIKSKKGEITMVYNLNDLPLTLRVEEVAEILRIGRGSAYELIRCGRLHAIRMGRRILVPRSSLESFLTNAA